MCSSDLGAVVDVEQAGVGALEQQAAAGLHGVVQAVDGVGDMRAQPLAGFGEARGERVWVKRRRLHAEFAAKAVEMEGGAVAQVAQRWGNVPFVNVRCLSDLAGRSSHLDFRPFLPVAARYASVVAHRLAPAI